MEWRKVPNVKGVPVQSRPRPKRRPKPKPAQRRSVPRRQPPRIPVAIQPFTMQEGDRCLIEYGKAYDNPFVHQAVCIPSYPTWPSRKLLTRQFGTFSTGSAGTGFITFQPDASQDFVNIVATNTTYPDAACTVFSTVNSYVTGYTNTGSPYTFASFGNAVNQLQCRIALAAIRIKYIGTDLNMSGSIFPITNTNSATTNLETYSQLRINNANVPTQPINRSWHTTRWLPNDPTQQTYAPTSGTSIWPMAICITGFNTSTPGTFEFEAVTHAEIVGRGIDTTPSYSTSKWADFSSAATTIGATPARQGGMAKMAESVVAAGKPYLVDMAKAGAAALSRAAIRKFAPGF